MLQKPILPASSNQEWGAEMLLLSGALMSEGPPKWLAG